MNRMNTRNNGAYFTWATRRYALPSSRKRRDCQAGSRPTRIPSNVVGALPVAAVTMENQSRSGLSASACFLQKGGSVLRLISRTGARCMFPSWDHQSVRQRPLSSGDLATHGHQTTDIRGDAECRPPRPVGSAQTKIGCFPGALPRPSGAPTGVVKVELLVNDRLRR
jgi:hypothetical protein